jgi:hypothetical protein
MNTSDWSDHIASVLDSFHLTPEEKAKQLAKIHADRAKLAAVPSADVNRDPHRALD